MNIVDVLKKQSRNKIENVELLGKVLRYVDVDFELKSDVPLLLCEVEVYALKYLGAVYTPNEIDMDSIVLTKAIVYCFTTDRTLQGDLVTIKNATKGVNLTARKNKKGETFINCFNMYKSGNEWVYVQNKIVPFVKYVSNLFSDVAESIQQGTFKFKPEHLSYKQYKISYDTLDIGITTYDKVKREFNLDTNTLFNIAQNTLDDEVDKLRLEVRASAKTTIHQMYDYLYNTFGPYALLDLFPDASASELKGERVFESVGAMCRHFLGTDIVAKISSNPLIPDQFDELMTWVLKNPYRYGIYWGSSVDSCDKIFHFASSIGLNPNGRGRKLLSVIKEYESQNSTLIPKNSLDFYVNKPEPNFKYVKDLNKSYVNLRDIAQPLTNLEDFFQELVVDDKSLGYVLWSTLYKELYIAKEFKKRQENKTHFSQNDINKAISSMPFELEPAQKEALGRVNEGIVLISGCAGSGKTTIAKAMRNLFSSEKMGTMFLAPTGTAAGRLSASIDDEARTIHSALRLSLSSLGYLGALSFQFKGFERDVEVLVFDESSMINLDTAFRIFKAVENTDIKLLFMGDEDQLQAIGNGAIFRDFVKLNKPQKLSVSKRFEESSLVGVNCKRIVESQTSLRFDLITFVMDTCEDALIRNTVIDRFFKEFQRGTTLENLQIATPYVNPMKAWSSTSINGIIHERLFENSDELYLGTIFNKSIFMGEKMVHSGVNIKDMPVFEKRDSGFCLSESKQGVLNGDVGFIEDLVEKDSLELFDKDGYNMISDTLGSSTHGLVFRLMSGGYIIYPCKVRFTEDMATGTTITYLISETAKYLEYAYAMTVHKLQGSEYNTIIFPISMSDNNRFVCKEMVYTAISRAKNRVILVGNQSQIPKSLSFSSSRVINTVLELTN